MQVTFCARARSRAPGRSFFVAALLSGAALFCGAASASSVTISGTPPQTVTAGSAYRFTPSAHDSLAGHTLSFGISNKPSWATFNWSTGELSGTPTASNVGKFANILIAVSDGTTSALLATFSITVQAAASSSPPPSQGAPSPGAPSQGTLSISGSPASAVSAGKEYSFTPTAKDSSGRTLSFGISNKPSWAAFNWGTGELSGTPTASNVGKFANILIAVSDGTNSALLATFSITVQAAGAAAPAPTVTISGTPATSVNAGGSYSFQPTAKDSAGRTVSFSVANKPSWATFSIASGLLAGTPTTSQTGSYANVTISASDGESSSALAPFTIKVAAPPVAASGVAFLSWGDPTQNTNGTTLTNLAGIHIYYGQSESAMSSEVTVANSSQTSYTLSGLSAGTWYFAAVAYTTSGAESGYSQIGSKTIQ